MFLPSICVLSIYITAAIIASYSLSLHDALPISLIGEYVLFMVMFQAMTHVILLPWRWAVPSAILVCLAVAVISLWIQLRSEEHTSELQSRGQLVCRLLLEK